MVTGAVAAVAQQRPLIAGLEQPEAKSEAVRYLFPEQINLPAHKATAVALHFRIAPGLHINAHQPLEKDLIATSISIPEGMGVRLEGASYPKGALFALPEDPSTRLLVYTGEFVVDAKVIAEPGEHLVEAKLRYQACDNRACMPPRTIPITIDVIGH